MAVRPNEALNRLPQYNSGFYGPNMNPFGFADGGHIINFPMALQDTASAIAYGAALAGETEANAAAVVARLEETVAARDLARRWASAPEDVDVGGGHGSAFHYAQKAAKSAAAAATFNPADFVNKATDRERLFGRKIIRSRIDYGGPAASSWEFAPLQIEAYIGPNGEGAGSGCSISFVDHQAGIVLHVGMGPGGALVANGSRVSLAQDLTAAIDNIAAVLRNEAAGKFDKSGGAISGVTRVTSGPGTGNIGLQPGDGRYTGFLDFILPNGARAAYLGQVDQLDPDAPLPFVTEGGRFVQFNVRPRVNGSVMAVVADLLFQNIGGSVQPGQQVLRPDVLNGIGSYCAAVWIGAPSTVQGIGNTYSGADLDDPVVPGNRYFTGAWRIVGFAGVYEGRAIHLWQRYA